MRYTPLATDAHGGLCPMPYALCPMPARAPHVTEKGYNSYFSLCVLCVLCGSRIKLYSSPQQNCFSPKTTPQQFPPEKLKTMLQLIAFESPVHGTRDKLANSDKMTDVVVSD